MMHQIKQWKFAPYTLQPLKASAILNNRQGTLLQIDFADGLRGYADCHPWVTCGDQPLQQQLESLANGTLTALLHRSLHFARLDAEARADGSNILQRAAMPRSHWLSLDPSDCSTPVWEGISYIKIKGQESLLPLIKSLPEHFLLRPDFNSTFSREQFEHYLEQHKEQLHRFDYFEDPFPFDEKTWQEVQGCWNISLACDRKSSDAFGKPACAKVIIYKPAVQYFDSHPSDQRLVVTSYLDHPLGQVAAAFEASRLCWHEVSGLNSHRVYEPTAFSQQLSQHGSAFNAPKGVGFGFDELLTNMEWQLYNPALHGVNVR